MGARSAIVGCAWAVLALGCAGTPVLQSSAVFATAGAEYADTGVDFIDAYLVARVDGNSKDLLRVRKQLVDARLRGELPERLAAFDAEAFDALEQAARLRDNVRLLGAYFQALEALAASGVDDDGAAALRSLGAAINDANAAARGDASRFSTAQLTAIERSARIVVRAVVAQQVRDALERDRETIAWQIAWQERMLAVLVEPLRAQYQRDVEQLREVRVVAPFTGNAATLPAAWVDDRRRFIVARFSLPAFTKAETAARRMHESWDALLAGRSDLPTIRIALAELRDLSAALRVFAEAERRR
jgi:hypothetical protein